MKASIRPLIFIALLGASTAWSATPTRYRFACSAQIDCPSARLKSAQDLPGDELTTVQSSDVQSAALDCQAAYPRAYSALERTSPEGCSVVPDAAKVESTSNR